MTNPYKWVRNEYNPLYVTVFRDLGVSNEAVAIMKIEFKSKALENRTHTAVADALCEVLHKIEETAEDD